MKLIITTCGVGKSTYVKNYNDKCQGDSYDPSKRRAVDLDFTGPRPVDPEVVKSITRMVNQYATSQSVDVLCTFIGFIDLNVLNNTKNEMVIVIPDQSMVEEIAKRIEDRDGNSDFANSIRENMEQWIADLEAFAALASKRMVSVDTIHLHDGQYLSGALDSPSDDGGSATDQVKPDAINEEPAEVPKEVEGDVDPDYTADRPDAAIGENAEQGKEAV